MISVSQLISLTPKTSYKIDVQPVNSQRYRECIEGRLLIDGRWAPLIGNWLIRRFFARRVAQQGFWGLCCLFVDLLFRQMWSCLHTPQTEFAPQAKGTGHALNARTLGKWVRHWSPTTGNAAYGRPPPERKYGPVFLVPGVPVTGQKGRGTWRKKTPWWLGGCRSVPPGISLYVSIIVRDQRERVCVLNNGQRNNHQGRGQCRDK